MTKHLLTVLAFCAFCQLMIGCGSSIRFQGRVIAGPVGVATVVPADDGRLSEPGIPGVEVTLLKATSTRGGALVSQVTTDENGTFEVLLGRGQHPGGPVIVKVEGDPIFDARSRAFLPSNGQSLLCTVIERESQQTR